MLKKHYTFCKDNTADTTIDILKNLLNKNNIEINIEELKRSGTSATSFRLTLKGSDIGTNGKGINRTNALASGYAEFIERLQTQFLFSFIDDSYTTENDYEFLKNNIYAEEIENKNSLGILQQTIYECKKYYNQPQKVAIQKFYSVRTKKEIELPTDIIHYFQGSNGMASGNTYEEAIVQGLCEICERYTTKLICMEHKRIPTIPKQYYEQYTSLKDLVRYIESNGYKITIKDASNGDFPVIMTIFEDLKHKENGFIIKSGAHPYFPIAVERTLTEFLQGFDIEDEADRQSVKAFKVANNDDLESIIYDITKQHTLIDMSNKNFDNLFQTNADYDFNPNIWGFKEKTNKEMLKSLCLKFLDHTEDIYIRNCNFIGFPCVYIYAPKMSKILSLSDETLQELLNIHKIRNNLKEKEYSTLTAEKLFKACNFNAKHKHKLISDKISNVPPEFVALYCAIINKDSSNIQKYLKKILNNFDNFDFELNQNYKLKNKNFYQALDTYFNLEGKGYNRNDIKTKLKEQYDDKTSEKVFLFLYTLNLPRIIQILEKKYIPNEDYIKEQNLGELKSKLKQVYLQNPPKQKIFAQIFDSIGM